MEVERREVVKEDFSPLPYHKMDTFMKAMERLMETFIMKNKTVVRGKQRRNPLQEDLVEEEEVVYLCQHKSKTGCFIYSFEDSP